MQLRPPSSREQHGYVLLGIALCLVLLFHGVLLFNQNFISTYDALIHIFFASHYAQSWFDPWEPRWYTGFMTVAYPPLSHYLIALCSKLIGLKMGFAVVQLFALLQLTIGVFRFSRLLFDIRVAGYASLAMVLSSSISETVHLFGQLPTTLSLGFLLNALPFIWRYIAKGQPADLIKAVAWMAATTAAHHVTTLFGSVFFTGPLVVILLLASLRRPRPHEAQGRHLKARLARRFYRLMPRLYRTGLFGILAIAMLIIVVFPYWYWSGTDPILQVSIPHGSRENFLERLDLGLIFWLIPWMSSFWCLPYAIYKGLNWRWPVLASMVLLTILGTGGSTPIPRFLLGSAFDILTLDRFTFWATVLILPFLGMAFDSLIHGRLKHYLEANFGTTMRLLVLLGLGLGTLAAAVAISTLPNYRSFQPDPIDIQPIVNFIEKDEHWRYRYLTLGFGDQMAWLAANTKATTPDGNYHSARRLPELTTTPIERLEGAKYTGVPGLGSLEQFLTTPEKYHLKFIFSNDAFYDPALYFHGWHSLGRLENGIEVWEREDIAPLPERLARKTWPLVQRLMWGLLPMIAAIIAYLVLLLPSRTGLLTWPRSRFIALRHLLQEDALPQESSTDWQLMHRLRRLLGEVANFSQRPLGARLLASSLLLFNLSLPLYILLQKQLQRQSSPEAAVIAFWDDLDFKRFDAAYRWLLPQQGLTLERWQLDLSVVGGLRSGFAKLDAIEPQLLSYEGRGTAKHPRLGDRALVAVELTWLTALSNLTETQQHQLQRTRRGWRIEAQPSLSIRPQERFVGQPELNYYRAPRRLTTDTTSKADVLDRPRLAIVEARLVAYDQLKSALEFEAEAVVKRQAATPETTTFSVVGIVQNVDARPADLTVTAILRDAQGLALTHNNAATHVIHKLLPGEMSPFRIDFSAVAAPADPKQVSTFELFAKAVVTGRNLSRDLATWSYDEGQQLHIQASNIGTHEASVPQALISLFDGEGLAWLEQAFMMEAVPPREAREISVVIEAPPGYRVIDRLQRNRENQTVFDNHNHAQGELPRFPLVHPDFESYLVQFQAFYHD